MKTVYSFEYINNTVDFDFLVRAEDSFRILDHLMGFDKNYNNYILDNINSLSKKYKKRIKLFYHQILPAEVKKKYQHINFVFDVKKHIELNLNFYHEFKYQQKEKHIEEFLCCFVGHQQIGRQFLLSILHKTKLWNNETCTKNFSFEWDQLDGNLEKYIENKTKSSLIRKFFMDCDSNFNNKIITKDYISGEFIKNIDILKSSIEKSFVHLVAETMPDSYVPFVTEKFLQSVVCKGLFLSYAQPNWHKTIHEVHGFRLYDKIFDYNFDSITNPLIRIIKIIEMLSKFQHLSQHDWHDLIELERESIEYNYDHYYSKDYLKNLAKFE